MLQRPALLFAATVLFCTAVLFRCSLAQSGDQLCVEGDVRLRNGTTEREGRVEVCLFSVWGTVCDDGWNTAGATVVCRQLGYSELGARYTTGGYFPPGDGSIHLDDVVCTGIESDLSQCVYVEDHNCLHFEDAGVICEEAGFSCATGDVRLVGGNTPYEGLIEYCQNNTFGSVCDDGLWNDEDAQVVCNQLGYFGDADNRAIAIPGGNFGNGVGPVHVTGLVCNGDEIALIDCFTIFTFFSLFCRSSSAAGVLCPPPVDERMCINGDVRLVNGRLDSEGRVEVCYNNHWGTVCHDGWGDEEAMVVCRELGYPVEGAIPIVFSDFGSGEDLILLTNLNCTGQEDNLAQCPHNGVAQLSCSHFEDSGVVCRDPNNTCDDGLIRLADGATLNEGRLEICYYGHWGTVCDDGFNSEAATVACRQLGFEGEGAIAFPFALFEPGVGLIFLDDTDCIGNETRLEQCETFGEIGDSNCFHSEDVSILCPTADESVCINGDVRLADGTGNFSGRVEICFNNVWGTVCDDDWDRNDAEVVCQQLEFNPNGSIALINAFFGEGEGPIFLDDADCSLENDTSLIQCFYTNDVDIGQHNCLHSEDASVVCYCENCNCTNGEIRLVDGEDELEGRVEICIAGIWGTICNNYWSDNDAVVICRQLGYGATDALSFRNAEFGEGTGHIFLDTILCDGSEESLLDCYHVRVSPGTCSHQQDVGVRCSDDICTDGDVRLVDGAFESEGRIEICFNQQYGGVCDRSFDHNAAAVVCRQLGYSDGEGAIPLPFAFFGPGTRGISIDEVQCNGNESQLTDCGFNPDPFFCFSFLAASVLCQASDANCTNGDIRLAGGNAPYEGRVEVCFNSNWGSVCSDEWTNIDAQTVCSILGYQDTQYAITTSGGHFGFVEGPIFLDNVNCSGTEQSILECLSQDAGIHNCGHRQDVGVLCPVRNESFECTSGDLRLVDGLSSGSSEEYSGYEGRVEMCINGVWGTICDDFWDDLDAAVVCQQLGFGRENARAKLRGFYGLGEGPIYLDDVLCNGDEEHLIDCPSVGVGSFCFHSEDAGVMCQEPPCIEGDIRLFGGDLPSEGTIEICVNEEWGTVCDDFWDNRDAGVVCNQLGYESENAIALRGAHYGFGSGDIVIDDVSCFGNETSLLECEYVTDPFCFHFEDAGVICPIQGDRNCTTGDVRLVDGSTEYQGRVEVCIHSRWGTVCDDFWDALDAQVVCNQLGFDSNGIAYGGGGAQFGGGNDLIFLDDVDCEGTEQSLLLCRTPPIGDHNCGPSENAGVFCPNPNAPCANGDVRLVGGSTEYEGRVEVCLDGVWGTICADFAWGDGSAKVICKQLNYSNENAIAVGESVYGHGTGPILLSGLVCNGTEDNVLYCPTISSFFFFPFFCQDHSSDAGVVCLSNETCTEGDIRLQGGATENEGRVEICFNNHWGTVCDDFWDNNEASVVCRQLGFDPEGALAISRSYFGSGFGRIHLDDLFCNGTEGRLVDCPHDGPLNHNCAHSEDAGAICIVLNPACEHGDLRLLSTGPSDEEQLEGTLEICFGGNWGTICDDFWDDIDASVACRQLGFSPEGAVGISRALYGQGTGPIFLDDMRCDGNESAIHQCDSNGLAVHNCGHSEDAGVICKPIPCVDGTLRLENGYSSMNGRLEICVNEVWNTVCSFTDEMAGIACTVLGFNAKGAIMSAENIFNRAPSNRGISIVSICDEEDECLLNATIAGEQCTHDNDIGVFCVEEIFSVCSTGSMRLEGGGTNDREGRVEVCLDDTWGTVCDDSWDQNGADVICRQLFNDSVAGKTVPVTPYGSVSGVPILLDDVKCLGSESNLLSCPQLPLNQSHNCDHEEDVAVSCSGDIVCEDGDIQLIYGDIMSEGTILICKDDVWGTVCDDLYDHNDAEVVCRRLGYTDGPAIPLRRAHFGEGTGPILLDNLGCIGNETSLLDCLYGDENCDHTEDAGVICPAPEDSQTNCTNGIIRLVDGTSRYEGRVELCLHGRWGTVCDDFWDNKDAQVVCNQLGLANEGYAYAANNAAFGAGSGLIYLDNVHCTGHETMLLDCPSEAPGNHNCASYEDAGVYCPDPNAACLNGEVRLAGGETKYEGRVEMCVGGEWGTVCGDRFWDDTDATVVCRQLGLPVDFAVGVGGLATFGPGEGQVLFQVIQCNGSESALIQCPSSDSGFFSTRCSSHDYDASVICQDPNFTCNKTDVRLRDGATPNEGRVEICLLDHWGTLCDNDWDERDAQVVCRQLGYNSEGAVAARAGEFGQGFGRVHLDNLNCTGSEANIYDCPSSVLEQVNCFGFESDVGVICPSPNPVCTHGDVRLENGTTPFEGRVEVCVGGRWGTVCDDFWGIEDIAVVCKQLGHSTMNAQIGRFPVGTEDVPIFLDDLRCIGNESRLLDCQATPVGAHNCRHFEDAGAICQPIPCVTGTVRFSEGFSERNGRLEVCVNEEWATVCGKKLTQKDAAKACVQAGFSKEGVIIGASGLFGKGVGPIYPPSVITTPTSSTIEEEDCTHSDDAVIFCREDVFTECATGSVRLYGSTSPIEGRLEVCLNNQWGTVCDDSWHVAASAITCKALGYFGGEFVGTADFSDAGDIPILMDNVKCTGTESNLLSCPQLPLILDHNCLHTEDVGLNCMEEADCVNGDVRLMNGTVSSEGRVEVCVWGRWSTVCADSAWGVNGAQTICQLAGFEGGLALYDSYFGLGSGVVILNQFVCPSANTSLCQYGAISADLCSSHNNDAGVTCIDPNVTCIDGDVRLYGGANSFGGRVEICNNNQWNSVCADTWDDNEATVVCRQLGLPTEGATATPGGFYGDGNLNQAMSGSFDCERDDQRLDMCGTDDVEDDGICDSSAAGVICQATTVECSDGDVQLVNGASESEGRLQVCMGGLWGTVCDGDGTWGTEEAAVVCQQLGYSSQGAEADSDLYRGTGSGPVFLDKTQCTGDESDLLECDNMAAGGRCRNHDMDVGISCPVKQCEDGEIRLSDVVSEYTGRVEICYDTEWGTLCSDGADQSIATKVCTTLNFDGDGAILTGGGFFGRGSGEIYGSLDGSEPADSCTHEYDVGVICPGSETSACPNGAVRLADIKSYDDEEESHDDKSSSQDDSSMTGRVEVCLNGVWGTVCSDSWDDNDATVVCNQLNLDSKAAIGQTVGGGTGDIFLNNVKCTGKEPHILTCEQSPLNAIKHCTHDDDAGVICTNVETGETGASNDDNSDNTAAIVVPIILIIILIILVIVAITLGVLYFRSRKSGKTIFTTRSQPDQLPFAESTSYPEGFTEMEPEKTETL